MKLIIFGATGGTGQQLVTQALDQGHEVTAFARRPEKLEYRHPHLRLLTGDVLDPDAVARAIGGHDAVLCALGTPATDRKQLRKNGTRNIVQAMEQAGVRRLICQSSLGIGDSQGLLPFHYRYLIFPLILRYVRADHDLQEAVVRASELDWTLVRPAALTDGPRTGSFWHGFSATDQPLSIKISRADVAGFMLDQLQGDHYLRKAPSLSGLKSCPENGLSWRLACRGK